MDARIPMIPYLLRCIFAICLSAAVGLCPWAQAQEHAGPNPFFVYPVRTDLQRELAPTGTSVLVFIDMTEAITDDGISLEPIKLDNLRKALLPYNKDDTKLHFELFFPRTEGDRSQAQAILRYALIGVLYENGFRQVKGYGRWFNDNTTWAKYTAAFTRRPRKPDGDERAVISDSVKVFPVNSELSRSLTSDADCAIVTSIGETQGVIPQVIRLAAADSLEAMKLPHKNRVAFYVDRVLDKDTQLLLADFQKLAVELGFGTSSVTFR